MNELAIITDLQQRIALYEDMKAYKKLYELFFPGLYKFSYSFVKSQQVAEEIVSDVFIKIWSIRSTLETIDNLKVYLYTIAKNFSLNYITKHHKLRVINLDDVKDETFQNLVTPEKLLISADVINKINSALNTLPSQCRIIFYLVRESGLKYKEVASILNISVNTVRNQLAIATKKIADALPLTIKADYLFISKFSES